MANDNFCHEQISKSHQTWVIRILKKLHNLSLITHNLLSKYFAFYKYFFVI